MEDLICVTGYDYRKLAAVLAGLGVVGVPAHSYDPPTAGFIAKDRTIHIMQRGSRITYSVTVRKWLSNHSDKTFYIEGGTND